MNRALPTAIVVILFAGLMQASPAATAAATLHEVSGLVVSDAGAPLAGVNVYGYSYASDGTSMEDKNQTDANGRFSLKLGEGKASVNAYYEKWSANAYEEIVVPHNGSLTFTLQTPPPRTAIVTGIIHDIAGKPIAGALVTLNQGCCYLMKGETPSSDASGGSASANEGSTEPAVDPASSSMPITRPCCCCYDYDQQEVTTGADGVYRFETYAGPRSIAASAKGFAHTTIQLDAKENATVTRDITLEKVPPKDAVFTGRVVDAQTNLPIANAGVSLNNLEWSAYDYATTGPDGLFTLKSYPGWTMVNVYVNGYVIMEDTVSSEGATSDLKIAPSRAPERQYYAYVKTLDLVAGENKLDVKLEAKPTPTVVLVGYVVDPDAKEGIPGVNVNVWNQDTGDWGNAITDATGSYKLLVRAGHYTINTYAQGYFGGAEMFVIKDGEATKRVDVNMAKGETKYAPCEDCDYGYPMPMAAERSTLAGVASMEGGSDGSTQTTSADKNEAGTLKTGSSPPTDDSTRAAAYSGSGGGLPKYDPDSTSTVPAAANTKPTPAAGIVFALGALGLVALALRRRQ